MKMKMKAFKRDRFVSVQFSSNCSSAKRYKNIISHDLKYITFNDLYMKVEYQKTNLRQKNIQMGLQPQFHMHIWMVQKLSTL